MRRTLAILPALVLAATLSAQAPKAATKMSAAPKATPPAKTVAPAKAPSLTPRPSGELVIHMLNGPDKLLSTYRGKFVVLAFMYTTCSHCQHTAGLLSKIQTEYASKGVQMLGVTIDKGAKEGIPVFLRITGANFPVGYSDPAPALRFMRVDTNKDWFIPMLAFIDQKGIIRSQYVSYGEGGDVEKFLDEQDGDPAKGDKGSIRRELDKYLTAGAPAKK